MPVLRVCQRCHEEFTLSPSDLKQGKGRYCSMACRREPRIEKECPTCGGSFQSATTPGHREYRDYCSLKCVHRREYRPPVVNGNGTATIPLTKGYEAVVDIVDLPKVEGMSWQAMEHRNTVYAVAGQWGDEVLMHRLILNTPVGMVTDHIDRNGLNNRRSNLRAATHQENQMNRGPQINNSSGYKGVKRQGRRFVASIQGHRIGIFSKSDDAARAYDQEARVRFGKFAYTNFPIRKAS